jgi:hypothetical protein
VPVEEVGEATACATFFTFIAYMVAPPPVRSAGLVRRLSGRLLLRRGRGSWSRGGAVGRVVRATRRMRRATFVIAATGSHLYPGTQRAAIGVTNPFGTGPPGRSRCSNARSPKGAWPFTQAPRTYRAGAHLERVARSPKKPALNISRR